MPSVEDTSILISTKRTYDLGGTHIYYEFLETQTEFQPWIPIKGYTDYPEYNTYFVDTNNSNYKSAINPTLTMILNGGYMVRDNVSYSVSFSDVTNLTFEDRPDTDITNYTFLIGQATTDLPHFKPRDANGNATNEPAYHTGAITQIDNGDIWINTQHSSKTFPGSNSWDYRIDSNTGTYEIGSVAYVALMHEMGHVLKLKEAANTTLDSHQYSIMSYNELSGMEGSNFDEYTAPAGLQIYDILTLQFLYKRNYTTRSDDTEYKLGYGFTNNVDDADQAFIYTIWDGNGIDTISAEGFYTGTLGSTATFGAEIDLRQGAYSSIGSSVSAPRAVNNVGIAYYTVIENAKGSDLDDNIIGNAWNNKLEGNGGDDTIYGDGIISPDHDIGDSLKATDAPDDYINAAPDGSGQDYLLGGSGHDLLYGGDGRDILEGGDDNDYLYGGYKSDRLDGGSGIDHLFGEDGNDRLMYSPGDFFHGGTEGGGAVHTDGVDTVDASQYTQGAVVINLNDETRYFSIENVIGSNQSDIIFGKDGMDTGISTNNDVLAGMKGNDLFLGSVGNDIYHGGYNADEMGGNWHVFGIDDLSRNEDGNDTVDYTGLDAHIEVIVVDASKGNYIVDKYYGTGVHNGLADRDYLYSIETIYMEDGTAFDHHASVMDGFDGTRASVQGTNDSDTLNIYTPHPDLQPGTAMVLSGLGGNDNLYGNSGSDILIGGQGNDYLKGGEGDDYYIYNSGDGDDFIYDSGYAWDHNVLVMGEDISSLSVTLTRDYYNMQVVVNGEGTITLNNQMAQGTSYAKIGYIYFQENGEIWDLQGKQIVINNGQFPGTGNTIYHEGALVDDLIYGSSARNYLYGYDGNDEMYGEGGNDYLYAGNGDDSLYGGSGFDYLYGQDGNDKLYGSADGDYLIGGNGYDTAYYGLNYDQYNLSYENGNLKVELAPGIKDTLGSIERIVFADGIYEEEEFISFDSEYFESSPGSSSLSALLLSSMAAEDSSSSLVSNDLDYIDIKDVITETHDFDSPIANFVANTQNAANKISEVIHDLELRGHHDNGLKLVGDIFNLGEDQSNLI